MHVIFGTGPLGRAVAAALHAQGTGPIRLVNRRGHSPAGLSDLEVVAGDLTDPASARRAAEGASVVYHCAGAPYTEWAEIMPAMMEGAVAAAESAKARLVFGGNLYAYAPDAEQPLTETAPERPETRKGRVRKAVADRLRAAHEGGRVRATIGRASDFYGPGVEASAVGEEVFGRLAEGKAPRLLGDPEQPHTFTFVEDFGRALALLARREEAFGQTWHVPSAPPVPTRAFAEQAAEAMGQEGTAAQATPSWLIRIGGYVSPMMREVAEMLYEWEKPFVVSHAKFERAFGEAFGPPTPLEEGIRRTAAAATASQTEKRRPSAAWWKTSR